ncbi:MAG: outer membrane lipoprotein carrier protein LolA [Rhodobacteraceae bacterium]|nr:outer membrane lipoprotein carrier protein LolA [Paracoccaceae bacterium]
MKRLAGAVLVAAGLMAAPVAHAQEGKLSLGEVSSYLNALTTVEGAFTQINGDGSISTGKLYLKRPGRMRFEYNPPDTALVVASAGAVVIADGKSNQNPETYPLRRTPLSLILDKDVNLSRAEMVVGHDFDGTATVVTAQDPEHPEYGNIQMKFTANPVELRQWVVNDSGGGSTTVILGEVDVGGAIPNRLFDIERPNPGNDR